MQVIKKKGKLNYIIASASLTIIFLLLLVCNLTVIKSSQVFAENAGITEIKLERAVDLYKICMPENIHKNFVLTNDIDLQSDTSWYEYVLDNEKGWMPISAASNTGVFDGNGHKISNIKINRADMQEVGLFSECSLTIMNLYVESEIKEDEEAIIGGELAGVICAKLVGNLENVSAKGTVRSRNMAGGLTGQVQGSILNSDFEGSVYARCAGGLVGNSVSAKIVNSYAYANVTGKVIGGLIGIADYGTFSGDIRNVLAFCTFSNSEEEGLTRIGGFVGIKSDDVNIVNGYALNEYPCVAQGSDSGILSLSKFAFVVEENFDLDFDNVWYLSESSLFPKIRHLIVNVESNSQYIEESQLMDKTRYYENEKVVLKIPEKYVVKNMLVNGKESNIDVADKEFEIIIKDNLAILIEFEFFVEMTLIVTGEGTVKSEKSFYQDGEIIEVRIQPDDGYTLDSVKARFNNDDIQPLESNDSTYRYQIIGDIQEGDQLVVYAVFEQETAYGLPWWAIMLIVLGTTVVVVTIATVLIYIERKKTHRKEV